jgi:hypothetical protein
MCPLALSKYLEAQNPNSSLAVRLTNEERGVCQDILEKLKGSSQRFRRAQILLKADEDGPGWIDAKIAEAFDCGVQMIESLRKRLVTEGFQQALNGKKRSDTSHESTREKTCMQFEESQKPLFTF